MKQTLIVNLFGGPGSGKSTQAAGLFYRLKMRGFNCELITEKAKEFTWEGNQTALSHQMYVSGHQTYRQERVESKVDVIITDSPTLIGLLYHKKTKSDPEDSFSSLLLNNFKSKWNYNVLLKRCKDYEPIGRNQTEKEARAIDRKNKRLLKNNDIEFSEFEPTPESLIAIESEVLETLNQKMKIPDFDSKSSIIKDFQNWIDTTDQKDKFDKVYVSFKITDDLTKKYQIYNVKAVIHTLTPEYDDELATNYIEFDIWLFNNNNAIRHTDIIDSCGQEKDIKYYSLYEDIVILK